MSRINFYPFTVEKFISSEGVQATARDFLRGPQYTKLNGQSIQCLLAQSNTAHLPPEQQLDYLWDQLLISITAPQKVAYKYFLNNYMHQNALFGLFSSSISQAFSHRSKGQYQLLSPKWSTHFWVVDGDLYLLEKTRFYRLYSNQLEQRNSEALPFVQASLALKLSITAEKLVLKRLESEMDTHDERLLAQFDQHHWWQKIKTFFIILIKAVLGQYSHDTNVLLVIDPPSVDTNPVNEVVQLPRPKNQSSNLFPHRDLANRTLLYETAKALSTCYHEAVIKPFLNLPDYSPSHLTNSM